MTKVVKTFYMEKEYFDMFSKKYPHLASIFVRKCFKAAVESEEFFRKVFFDVPLEDSIERPFGA